MLALALVPVLTLVLALVLALVVALALVPVSQIVCSVEHTRRPSFQPPALPHTPPTGRILTPGVNHKEQKATLVLALVPVLAQVLVLALVLVLNLVGVGVGERTG